MGDLIVMTRPTRLSPAIIGAGVSADILFFTGVRYYRTPEVPTVPLVDHSGPTRRRPVKVKTVVAAKKPSPPRHPKRRLSDHH